MNIIKTILFILLLSPSTTLWSKIYLDADSGLAFNSNIYLAPSSSYVDFFADRNGGITVDPIVHSGFFVPLNINASYAKRLDKKRNIIADYDFRSQLYLNERFRNANEYTHIGRLGMQYKIHNFKKRKSSIYAGIVVGDRDRDYFDRDTGDNKNRVRDAELEDVSDLYSYSTNGIKLEYNYWRKLNWNFNIEFRLEQHDYADIAVGSEYDNRFTRLKLDYNYRFNRTFRLALDYSLTQQKYDERSSRNLHGQLFSRHPQLEYTFSRVGVALVHRIDRNLRFRYGYELSTRTDAYLGYNDYTQNEFFTTLRYKLSNRLIMRANVTLRNLDYPNAWNFDRDPALNPAIINTSHKSATNTNLSVEIDYTLNKNISLFGSVEYRDRSNTDPRFNYNRAIFMIGATIQLL